MTDAAYPMETKGAIWIEQYCENEQIKDEILSTWYELIQKYSTFHGDTYLAYDAITERKIAELRHKVPQGVTEFIAQHGFSKAVPDKNCRELFEYGCEICIERGIKHVVWGHIGNSHLHINVLPKSAEEYEKATEAFDLILDKSLEFGGTISGEHGIGKIKKKHFHKMYKDELTYFREIKQIFDPNGIFSPGNLF
jgi:D-lactate dehydrogenase (cytochrome)